MDKILLIVGALALGIGVLFLPRTARAGEVTVTFPEDNFVTPSTSPFGLRNNNPFNLRFIFPSGIGWRGETGENEGFSTFDTAQNGIRAGMINIHTKMTRDRADTVRKLITILSPPNENPTDAFVRFVADKLNVSPDQKIEFGQRIIQLSQAIIRFENGQQPFTFDELEAALRLTGRV